MPVVGTAGHVDHGKSTLVQRLTGRDPDRLAEEKRRGLTIDLGFAWATLRGGVEVSFVDVPGHERFLKNMLAGIEAIDVALFVVAVDEGWMPQSEEHLAVLDLLGVTSGLVALTKIDGADPDLVELAQIEISERLEGTTLEGASVFPVSASTGEGVDDLTAALDDLTNAARPLDRGRPRLWVDRSFSAPGAGTVVTGTLLEGSLSLEDEVSVYPDGPTARVRRLESHETAHDRLEPGRRAAVNLGGVDRGQVTRGQMLGRPGDWRPTDRFSARIDLARYVDELGSKGAFQMHVGSGAHRVEISAPDQDRVVIRLPVKLPLRSGDRFIIRDTGRRLVVAGGRVLDPDPGPTRRALRMGADLNPDSGPDEIATKMLAQRGTAPTGDISADSGGGTPAGARLLGDLWITETVLAEIAESSFRMVTADHARSPLRVGTPIATLAERLRVSTEVLERVIDDDERLEREGPDVRKAGRRIELSDDAVRLWQEKKKAMTAGLAVPTIAELGIEPELLHYLVRSGELVRISEALVLLPDQVEEVRSIVAAMPPGFTVADFRDKAGLTRRYAVPFLEWADREGLTVRSGDTRTAR